MNAILPRQRIEWAGREVGRYRDDAAGLAAVILAEPSAPHDPWIVARQIDKANQVFHLLIDLDLDFRRQERKKGGLVYAGDIENGLRELLRMWLSTAEGTLGRSEKDAPGLKTLADNVAEARGILTPDDEFFDSEELAALRDEAIDEHRAGRSEPLESLLDEQPTP